MKILRYIFFYFVALTIGGCGDILDTTPQQAILEGTALNSSANVKKTLKGAYNDLGSGDVYGGRMYLLPDLLGSENEVEYTGTQPPPQEIVQKNITVNNGFVTDLWLDSYEAINVANNVLSALNVVNETDRDRVEGEAKFIRAIIYFQLVQLFAKDYNDGNPSQNMGVPLTLSPARLISKDDHIPRNSVQQVYEQIIKDLNKAKSKLNQQPPGYVYADTYAASAFLGRVYLQKGAYELARNEANRVITEGPYSLAGNYADAFNHSSVNTSEDIFALQVSTQDGNNALHGSYASLDEAGSRSYSVAVTQQHINLYKTGDSRSNLFYKDDNGNWHTGKWKNQYGNVNVIRLAEMYLIRAEANKRLNETIGATPTEDINTIRNRAGLEDAPRPVTLDDIFKERHRELAFEGHFLFDLKRKEGAIKGISWDAPRLVFPIPQRELDANSELIQNEGYGE